MDNAYSIVWEIGHPTPLGGIRLARDADDDDAADDGTRFSGRCAASRAPLEERSHAAQFPLTQRRVFTEESTHGHAILPCDLLLSLFLDFKRAIYRQQSVLKEGSCHISLYLHLQNPLENVPWVLTPWY